MPSECDLDWRSSHTLCPSLNVSFGVVEGDEGNTGDRIFGFHSLAGSHESCVIESLCSRHRDGAPQE